MNKGISIIFYIVLYMSVISTFIALSIMMIRWVVGRRVPAFFNYALWSILLVRLIVPMTFASESSIFNYLPTTNKIQVVYSNISKSEEVKEISDIKEDVKKQESHININAVSNIWIIVTAGLFIAFTTNYILSMNKFREGILYKSYEVDSIIKSLTRMNIRVYTVEWVDTPMVCGILKPKIIVPTHITQEKNKDILKAVILHELVHIKRRDNIIKLISIFTACVHWFNPVVWRALVLSHIDMEKACDEKVMQITAGKFKKKYAESLLSFAIDKSNITNTATVSFGESNIKKRIDGVLKYNKTKLTVKIITITMFVCATLLLITDESKSIVQANLNTLKDERQESWVNLNDISPFVEQAILASQDQNFYYHNGIDLIAIVRASVNSLTLKNEIQGASTVTMQLIKNVCEYNKINVLEKKRTQIYSAINLEKNFSKEEIIEAYINVTYYGRDIRGLKNAAQYYFNKSPLELTKEESAKLIAILDNPKEYDILSEKENNGSKAKLIISKINKMNKDIGD